VAPVGLGADRVALKRRVGRVGSLRRRRAFSPSGGERISLNSTEQTVKKSKSPRCPGLPERVLRVSAIRLLSQRPRQEQGHPGRHQQEAGHRGHGDADHQRLGDVLLAVLAAVPPVLSHPTPAAKGSDPKSPSGITLQNIFLFKIIIKFEPKDQKKGQIMHLIMFRINIFFKLESYFCKCKGLRGKVGKAPPTPSGGHGHQVTGSGSPRQGDGVAE